MVALVGTQLAGWSGTRTVAIVQALTPYVLAAAFPLAAAAVVARRWPLAAVGVAVAIALVVLIWPLRFPKAEPAPRLDAVPLRVFNGNLFHENDRTADVVDTIIPFDADVLTFTEYTAEHAARLLASSLADTFPHRIEYPEPLAAGSAIWSRYPITETATPRSRFRSIGAVVDAPDPIALYVVHPPSPLVNLNQWHDELERLASFRTAPGRPAMVVGDFNASYWHPVFRALLGAGWRDAHQQLGRGLSNSWPANLARLPPYVRLDHALVDDLLAVVAVDDVDIPGGDHRGLLVDVALSG
jgi:endonuclease/exonuclease/phosphatase (EEP) superfamily protein YafD